MCNRNGNSNSNWKNYSYSNSSNKAAPTVVVAAPAVTPTLTVVVAVKISAGGLSAIPSSVIFVRHEKQFSRGTRSLRVSSVRRKEGVLLCGVSRFNELKKERLNREIE